MQSHVRFNRVPEEGSGEGLEGFGAESTGFPKKVPEKVWKALVQSQQGSGEGSGEGLGGFGAEPGQVQQDLRPFNSRNPS